MDNGWKLWGKKEKKVILDEKMGKVVEGKKKEREKEKKRKMFHCILKILC
jgi:hypothetical protein